MKKSEKGSISLYVLVAMMFFLIFAVTTYIGISNSRATQIKAQSRIKDIYEQNEDEVYDKVYAKLYDTDIPPEWRGSVDELSPDGIPVPKDFNYVDGDKDTGIVIRDIEGNEFVWVPVDDMADFKRDNFGRGDTLAEVSTTNAYWDDKTTTEYQNMVASVETYGGFYIARYEASFGSGTAVANYKPLSKPSTSNSTGTWANTNGRLWNYITQVNAITVCSNMYGSEASVVSHLPWGIEWDTMLAWLRDTAFKNEANPNSLIAGNSTSWGNYYNASFKYGLSETQKNASSTVLINTGEITNPENRHMKNNIYDIAGNLREWTQEKYSTGTDRAYRGGSFISDGESDPVANRSNLSEVDSYIFIGFRPVLYIK